MLPATTCMRTSVAATSWCGSCATAVSWCRCSPRCSLLVDDHVRLGRQRQCPARRDQVDVLVVEQLEAVEPAAIGAGEGVVLGDLVRPVAEAVHVHDQGHAGGGLEQPPVVDHPG